MEILHYEFMRNALMAAVLVNIACGIVGTYVVIKKMVFISGGISHATFGGIGLGYFLGINPIIAAIPFSILCALGLELLAEGLKLAKIRLLEYFGQWGWHLGLYLLILPLVMPRTFLVIYLEIFLLFLPLI